MLDLFIPFELTESLNLFNLSDINYLGYWSRDKKPELYLIYDIVNDFDDYKENIVWEDFKIRAITWEQAFNHLLKKLNDLEIPGNYTFIVELPDYKLKHIEEDNTYIQLEIGKENCLKELQNLINHYSK